MQPRRTAQVDRVRCEMPDEAGWYIGRMKSWAIGDGFVPVKVTNQNGALVAWQCADERPWPIDRWEWRCRFFPGQF